MRDEPKKKPGFFESLIGYSALLSFAATFLCGLFGMEILEEHDMAWVVISLFGLTFVLFGLMFAISAKQPVALAVTAVGAMVLGASLCYGFGDDAMRDSLMTRIVPMMMLGGFAVAGLCLMTIPGILYRRKLARFTAEVQAKIVDKQLHRWVEGHGTDRRRHKSYFLTWRYYAGGEWITWKANEGRSPEPREVGDTDTLWLDPERLDSAWDKAMGHTDVYVTAILGIAFFLVGAVGLYLFLFIL